MIGLLFVSGASSSSSSPSSSHGNHATKWHLVTRLLGLPLIRRNRPGFKDYFEQQSGKPLPENPEFHFRFWTTGEDWEYAIVEEKSAVGFVLPHYFGVADG
jgi:hypothetical protein